VGLSSIDSRDKLHGKSEEETEELERQAALVLYGAEAPRQSDSPESKP